MVVVAVGVADRLVRSSAAATSRATAPQDVSFATRAARADLYGDAINDDARGQARPARSPPGCWSSTARSSTALFTGGAARVGGLGAARATRAERLRPLLRPLPPRRRAPRRARPAGGEPRMNDFPWLTVLLAWSRSSARSSTAFAARSGAPAKQVALVVSRAHAGASASSPRPSSTATAPACSSTETHAWIDAFGVHYALGVDGLGLLLVLLTAVLVPIVLLAAWNDAPDDAAPAAFFAWALALEALVARRLPRHRRLPLLRRLRGHADPGVLPDRRLRPREPRAAAAVKFLMFQLGGGLVLLASVIGLYVVSAAAGHAVVPAHRPAAARHRHQRRALAVRRLLHRLRDQGAAVPGAHLAGRHHRAGHPRHQRAAGLRARQDRHLRDAALLPRALPRGLATGPRRWSSCWR